MDLDKEKLKDLIHAIAYATRNTRGFGRTKLYKVMWFFEAREYTLRGSAYSGARYVRDKNGPRLHNYEKWFHELESEGRVSCFDEKFYNRTLKRVKAISIPKPGVFNSEQSKDLSYWINFVSGMTADEVSEYSHDYGWEIVSQGDEIPLAALLAERARPPSDEELDWARKRAKELGRV